jgi:hypothetical protein
MSAPIQEHLHNTVMPVAGAAVSCSVAFNWHAALGVAGQIAGLLSGVASFGWVAYQMWRSRKKD